MAFYPEPVARLIDALQRLPGIGPKTAQRLTFFLLKRPTEEVRELSASLLAVKERIVYCSTCFNVTDQDPCRICADPARDGAVVCVVEEPNDLLAMERTGEFKGRYHVLLGALSPLDGIGPDDLKVLTTARRPHHPHRAGPSRRRRPRVRRSGHTVEGARGSPRDRLTNFLRRLPGPDVP